MYVLRGDAPEDVAVWTSKILDCIWTKAQVAQTDVLRVTCNM
jgi:hypothetical protein